MRRVPLPSGSRMLLIEKLSWPSTERMTDFAGGSKWMFSVVQSNCLPRILLVPLERVPGPTGPSPTCSARMTDESHMGMFWVLTRKSKTSWGGRLMKTLSSITGTGVTPRKGPPGHGLAGRRSVSVGWDRGLVNAFGNAGNLSFGPVSAMLLVRRGSMTSWGFFNGFMLARWEGPVRPSASLLP